MAVKRLDIDFSHNIKRLEVVTKDLVTSSFVGNYQSVFKGRGLEFESYRPYESTDDANLIDWKASMRSNEIVVKEYAEERNLEVFFLVDSCSTMLYGTQVKLKNEYAAEIVAALSYTVLQAGDSVGLGMFANDVVQKLPPTSGPKQYYTILKQLSDPNNYGGKRDFEAAIQFLNRFLKDRMLLIIVSDFIGLHGEWEKYLKIASRKFNVIGVMVRDPADLDLPEEGGHVILEDPFSERQVLVDAEKARLEYNAFAREQVRQVREIFIKSKAEFVELTTDKHFIPTITAFFRRRSRRLS